MRGTEGGGGGGRTSGRESDIAPVRTCVGCRRTRLQEELVRYVRTPDGMLAEGRTLSGRGAWLCRESPACVEAAVRRRAFGRALRAEISPHAIEPLRENAANRVSIDGYGSTRKG
ncbi:MAG: YlxR family protein [Acidimicrobiia bacterium]|nr:YlxR family protein [Acidimicrobiia bacterium]